MRGHRFLRYYGVTKQESTTQSALSWISEVCDELTNSDLPLAKYFRSTFSSPGVASQATGKVNELFPCPPPYPWVVEPLRNLGSSRRKRARWILRRSVELWVNLMVCALSQEASGVEVAPLRGRRGASLTSSQSSMVSFLRTLASSVVRLGSNSSGCGLRLPATSGRLNQLREQLGELSDLPYAEPSRRFHRDRRSSATVATQALPVIAERLSLPEKLQDFDPRPFLSPVFRHLYEKPDDFLKPSDEQGPPFPAKGTATRDQLLKVFERWDRLGRLFICKAQDVSPLDRCELFAVAKDAEKDRQILHRKRRNLREVHVVGASKDLPHGVLLCQLPLEDRFLCASSVDDVKDFYHAYSASEDRARSSPVGPIFRDSEVRHLASYENALRNGRIVKGDRVACCFQGLGMGDHAAVDIAQESHVNLVRAYGGMAEGEVLNYRNPLPDPPSRFYEGIMIDDHLGLQLLEWQGSMRATLEQPARDLEAFASAEKAYAAANLEAHPKKRQRRSLHTKVWGVELEGRRGLVGPVRARLLALASLSAQASRPGPVDQHILEGLCGLRAFCAQFRRPMFCFMHSIYKQQAPGAAEAPFLLGRKARHELILLACLAPLCLTDLRALPDEFLYCVDASPSGAGVCRAKTGVRAVRELWRRSDKQGFRRPLLSRLSASLKGSGHDEEEVEAFLQESEGYSSDSGEDGETPHANIAHLVEGFLHSAHHGSSNGSQVPAQVADGPYDFLEVFGAKNHMRAAWGRRGFRVLPPLSLQGDSEGCVRDLMLGILGLVRGGRIRFLWLNPLSDGSCVSRSRRLRSRWAPWGFDLLDEETTKGNLHAAQSLLFAVGQTEAGNGFALCQSVLECMHEMGPWKLLKQQGAFEVLFDWCRYGARFKKTTQVLTNVGASRSLHRRCHHHTHHKPLRKSDRWREDEYSLRLCFEVFNLVQPVWDEHSGLKRALTTERAEDRATSCEYCDAPGAQRSVEELWCDSAAKGVQSERLRKSRQKRSSSLWAVQLSEALEWKTIMQYKFRVVQHINIQEAKARRSLVKRLPRDRRVVVAQDSRVNLGALGKGRSPSEALNGVMRSEAPYLLGKNLYLAGLHMPTWSIRADAPSRGSRVLPPRIPCPSWFWALTAGSHEVSDVLDTLEGHSRAINRWCLFIGALLLRASDYAQGCPASSRAGLAGTRPYHRTDAQNQARPIASARGLAGARASGRDSGEPGAASHRFFVRVARGIYDLHVRQQAESTLSGRNAQCCDPKVWMAEILACRALERTAHVGGPGAGRASSSDTSPGVACSCLYCSGMGLAASCGPAGSWLFWLIETVRSYRAATAGCFSAQRPCQWRPVVFAPGLSEDSSPWCSSSTCESRRAGSGELDRSPNRVAPLVESALERFVGGIQATL